MTQSQLTWIIENIQYIETINRHIPFNIEYHSVHEDYSFLVRVKKCFVYSELDAFLLLNERLEYYIQEWTEDEFLVNDQRMTTTMLFLIPTWKEMNVASITWKDFADQILEYPTSKEFEFFYEDKQHSVCTLIDRWNWIEAFGESDEEYFHFLWYTTA